VPPTMHFTSLCQSYKNARTARGGDAGIDGEDSERWEVLAGNRKCTSNPTWSIACMWASLCVCVCRRMPKSNTNAQGAMDTPAVLDALLAAATCCTVPSAHPPPAAPLPTEAPTPPKQPRGPRVQPARSNSSSASDVLRKIMKKRDGKCKEASWWASNAVAGAASVQQHDAVRRAAWRAASPSVQAAMMCEAAAVHTACWSLHDGDAVVHGCDVAPRALRNARGGAVATSACQDAMVPLQGSGAQHSAPLYTPAGVSRTAHMGHRNSVYSEVNLSAPGALLKCYSAAPQALLRAVRYAVSHNLMAQPHQWMGTADFQRGVPVIEQRDTVLHLLATGCSRDPRWVAALLQCKLRGSGVAGKNSPRPAHAYDTPQLRAALKIPESASAHDAVATAQEHLEVQACSRPDTHAPMRHAVRTASFPRAASLYPAPLPYKGVQASWATSATMAYLKPLHSAALASSSGAKGERGSVVMGVRPAFNAVCGAPQSGALTEAVFLAGAPTAAACAWCTSPQQVILAHSAPGSATSIEWDTVPRSAHQRALLPACHTVVHAWVACRRGEAAADDGSDVLFHRLVSVADYGGALQVLCRAAPFKLLHALCTHGRVCMTATANPLVQGIVPFCPAPSTAPSTT